MSLLSKILITCKEATLLAGKEQEKAITLKERIEMHLHLYYCKVCAIFYKQTNHLHKTIKELSKEENVEEVLVLADEKKAALQQVIDQELK